MFAPNFQGSILFTQVESRSVEGGYDHLHIEHHHQSGSVYKKLLSISSTEIAYIYSLILLSYFDAKTLFFETDSDVSVVSHDGFDQKTSIHLLVSQEKEVAFIDSEKERIYLPFARLKNKPEEDLPYFVAQILSDYFHYRVL